jgi:hypothetical protein
MLVSYHIAMFEDSCLVLENGLKCLSAGHLIIFGLPFALFPFDCASPI